MHRILSTVELTPAPRGPVEGTNCWLWRGSLMTDGYPAFWAGGKTVRGHRAAWIVFQGPIPGVVNDAMEHICNRSTCVNPRHLEPSTQRNNMRRKVRDQRANTSRLQLRFQDAVRGALRRNATSLGFDDGVAKIPIATLRRWTEALGGTIELVIDGRRLSVRRSTP